MEGRRKGSAACAGRPLRKLQTGMDSLEYGLVDAPHDSSQVLPEACEVQIVLFNSQLPLRRRCRVGVPCSNLCVNSLQVHCSYLIPVQRNCTFGGV